jgi:hypothetical protein
VPRGTLQQLRAEARMFCGMVVCFCKHLKWDTLARLIGSMQVRAGVPIHLRQWCRIDPNRRLPCISNPHKTSLIRALT